MPFNQKTRQLLKLETREPGRQAVIRIERVLRLHPDQMLDRLGCSPRMATEQPLPLKGGAVQRSPTDRLGSYEGLSLTDRSTNPIPPNKRMRTTIRSKADMPSKEKRTLAMAPTIRARSEPAARAHPYHLLES